MVCSEVINFKQKTKKNMVRLLKHFMFGSVGTWLVNRRVALEQGTEALCVPVCISGLCVCKM